MVELENKLNIPPKFLKKTVCANDVNSVAENAVRDIQSVGVMNRQYLVFKRMIDIILALATLLIIALPMLIVILIVYIDDPGDVIFTQYRVGMGGRRFKLYKLRTMRRDTPKYMSTSEVDDPNRYITRVGRILRRLSIDELPQLINVLKGDMSIVGPRPLISDEHEIHDLRMKFGVYKIRPGLTGLAQIRGRDMVTPADKVRWDVRYLEELGFWTDVKIVLSTIPKIIGGNGFAEGFRNSANEKGGNQALKITLIANDTTFIYNLRREVLAKLVEEGHQVTVLCQFRSHREALEQIGCRLYDIPIGRRSTNPLADLKLLCRFFQILRTIKPDVVLTNNIKPNVYAGIVCHVLGIKYIPNITGLGTPVENPGKLQFLATRLYKYGVAGADNIFFQNEENVRFFEQHHMMSKKSHVCLLPGSGVNLQTHPALPYSPGDVVHFLFVARLLKEKGIELYLSAAKRIVQNHPNVMFHICGGCDDPKYLEAVKEAEKGGYIQYHGEQKDMLPYFQMAHCVVHPSYYPEGMSNVLLEAAASGRPVIATDRSGCRETVEAGKTGYLIPIKDEDALVAALEDFLNLTWEQRAELGHAGRLKMEYEFDRQIVVQKYLDTLGAYYAPLCGVRG